MLYIGIDIHKRSHEVVILEDLGKPLGKSFKIGNSHDDLKHLFERIHTLNPNGDAVRFGMEATGHYCLTTISGIGNILAVALLDEIGDIRRFKNAKALVVYAGLDPLVMQSGEFTAKRAHLSKRGSTHLRHAVWLAAAAATRNDPALKMLLQRKVSEGKPYHVALGAVANKLLHIIYAVLRDNKPYYQAQIQEILR